MVLQGYPRCPDSHDLSECLNFDSEGIIFVITVQDQNCQILMLHYMYLVHLTIVFVDYNATVCILGHTGMGKSALCNLLSGLQQQDPDSFRVAPYFYEDRTQNCDVRNVKWMGKGQEFMIVDTPGKPYI